MISLHPMHRNVLFMGCNKQKLILQQLSIVKRYSATSLYSYITYKFAMPLYWFAILLNNRLLSGKAHNIVIMLYRQLSIFGHDSASFLPFKAYQTCLVVEHLPVVYLFSPTQPTQHIMGPLQCLETNACYYYTNSVLQLYTKKVAL